ncbi:MAG: Calx-beta domain-containing protein [Candidatus Promineifilaceae bacterium]
MSKAQEQTKMWKTAYVLIMMLCVGMVLSVRETNADVGSQAPQADLSELFVEVPSASCTNPTAGALQTRPATINFDALSTTDSFSFETTYQDIVTLNLFPTGSMSVTVAAELTDVTVNEDGGFTWQGQITGDELSQVTLTVYEQTGDLEMMGIVNVEEGIYAINIDDTGDFHCVTQLDPATTRANGNDAGELFAAREANWTPKTMSAQQARANDDGSVIDVMVFYTPLAKTEMKGDVPMQAMIRNSIALLNIAAENSGLGTRFQLVHSAETNYTRTSKAQNDAINLARDGDGEMDEMHALRNKYHADIVLLVVDSAVYTNGHLGFGFISTGGTPNTSSPETGVAVSTIGCTTTSCIAHEVGHVLGLRHDWYVDDTKLYHSGNHGYSNVAGRFRTIMSYDDHCQALGIFCREVLRYSNPTQSIGGHAVGVSNGAATNCVKQQTTPDPSICAADNVSALRKNIKMVAQYRPSIILWTGYTNNDWHTASNWDIVDVNTGQLAASTHVPRAIDDVQIPTNPGGGKMPVISANALARDIEIQDGAILEMTGGSLSMNGRWLERGTGKFVARAGAVTFNGSVQQLVQMGASSNLPDVNIGAGGNTQVTLAGNLDIDGNLTIAARSLFEAASHTIKLAGNWDDKGGRVDAGTGTVIFDGSADKTVDKVTAISVMSQDFAKADGKILDLSNFPAGWQSGINAAGTAADFFAGGNIGNPDGAAEANRATGSLYSTGFALQAGITYNLQVDAKYSSNGDTISLFYGTSNTLNGTPNLIKSHPLTAGFQTYNATFSVPTSDRYYLRFYSADGKAILDNIVINGTQNLSFYNLQAEQGKVTFNAPIEVGNNFETDANAHVITGSHLLSVEGTVTNNGKLEQTKTADNGTVSYAHIQDKVGSSDKYFGVDITPTGGALGDTTVIVRGDADCLATTTGNVVKRCYDIAPTNQNAATVKLYYRDAEANSNATPNIYHYGSSWDLEGGTTTRGGSGDATWVQVTGVDQYSPFAAGNSTPNAAPGTPSNAPLPNMTIANENVTEGAASVTLNVSLSAASTQNVTVNYATSNKTATAGQDYTTKTGILTIPAGQTSGDIVVALLDDTTVETPPETFVVTLLSSNLANITTKEATVTITDNDSVTSGLTIADLTVNESAGNASVVVTLANASAQVVTVNYATSDDSAANSSDYTAAAGILTIAANQTSGTITIPITNDTMDESAEMLKVKLSNPTNATIVDSEAVVTINDDDNTPSAKIVDVTVAESIGRASVKVILSNTSSEKVSFSVQTSDTSATAGQDYTTVQGTILIPAGQKEASVIVTIADDSVTEPNETFKVTLSNPQKATLSDAEAIATIADNDAAPATVGLLNPKFDNGMADWTAEVGTAFSTSGSTCGAGVAHLEDQFGSANVEQCIVVSTHATKWVLSAEMRALTETSASVSANFYASNNCSGNEKHSQEIETKLQTTQALSKSFDYDTNANGIGSIKVKMSADYTGNNFQGYSEACFDNLNLTTGGAITPNHKVFIPIVIR